MVLPDHQPLPELTHLPIEMPVEATEDETMIADTIVVPGLGELMVRH
jgi:hypothetical protein